LETRLSQEGSSSSSSITTGIQAFKSSLEVDTREWARLEETSTLNTVDLRKSILKHHLEIRKFQTFLNF
jgi:hypothetical protein